MPPEADKNAPATDADEKTDALSRDAIAKMINDALTAREKRQAQAFEKTVTETVTKALAAALPPKGDDGASASRLAEGGAAAGGKPDPAVAKLREELDGLKKKYEDAEKRARDTEDKARIDRTHGTLRERLVGAKVRPELLDAAHLLLTTRALKFDDAGNPVVTVKRVRERNKAAEAVEFNLDDGIADWLKSDEAKPFLPAPAPPPPRSGGFGGRADTPTTGAQGGRKPVVSLDDAVAQTVEDIAAGRTG